MTTKEVSASAKSYSVVRSRRPGLSAAALVSLALCAAAWHLSDWPARLRYPGEESRIEGMQLAEMVHLRQGVAVYARPAGGRFDATNYGPFYYLLGADLVDPVRPSALPMRAVSLISALGCAAAGALLAYWLTGSAFAAVLTPLIFFGLGFVTRYATTVRCDFPALLLILAGFLVAFRFRRDRRLLLSAPLLVLGLFFKQQFVAAPLAIVLFLLWERRYRTAISFAALVGAAGAGLLALFQFAVFRGQDFLAHVTTFNLLPPSGHRFLLEGQFFLVALVIPLILAIEFLRRHPDRLLVCYLGCAVLLSLASIGRVGSDTNYFLESALIASALIGALAGVKVAAGTAREVAELLVLLAVILFVGLFTGSAAPEAGDYARDRAIQDYLRQSFPAHTEALAFHIGDPLRAGLETPVSNLYHYVWLVRRGTLPSKDLTEAIFQRRFGVILLNIDLPHEKDSKRRELYLTPEMIQDILSHYQFARALPMPEVEKIYDDDHLYVWVPRPN